MRNKARFCFLLCVSICLIGCRSRLEDELVIRPVEEAMDLFYSYMDGPDTYRIPSMVVTDNGTLIVACDARYLIWKDLPHSIDIVMRRTFDYGKTWEPIRRLLNYPGREGIGDPVMVVDRETDTVWLFANYGDNIGQPESLPENEGKTLRIQAIKSLDDGETWSDPIEMNPQVKDPDWRFVMASPGNGIQLRDGTLVVPGYYAEDSRNYSYFFYSQDHGENWEYREGPMEGTGECQLVELNDGSIMMNMRNSRCDGCRVVAVTKDLGETWSEIEEEIQLPDPRCNASFIRYTSTLDGYAVDRLLFSNPPKPTHNDRTDLTIKLSYDEGQTWSVSKQILDGFSAYSSMAILPDDSIAVLVERSQYQAISFIRFTLEALTDGKDTIQPGYDEGPDDKSGMETGCGCQLIPSQPYTAGVHSGHIILNTAFYLLPVGLLFHLRRRTRGKISIE